MQNGTCRVCGRWLKNPKWVDLNIGPVCARKHGAGRAAPEGNQVRARYEIVKWEADRVTIRDAFDSADPTMSVTNDAEAVVAEMLGRGLGRRHLYYFDTHGQLDELKHDGVKFTGFAPGPRHLQRGYAE